jgi:hypothetical protein
LLDLGEQLKAMLPNLMAHTARVEVKLEVYEYLQLCQYDRRRDVIAVAPVFFASISDALRTDMIVTLHNLYDSSSGAKRSLFHYLTQAQTHFSSLKPSHPLIAGDFVRQQLDQIAQAADILKHLSMHRNKYYAHHDKQYFDNPDKLFEEAPLYTTDLRVLVELAQKILRIHYRGLFDRDRITRPINADDVRRAIMSIDRYHKLLQVPEVMALLDERDDLLADDFTVAKPKV